MSVRSLLLSATLATAVGLSGLHAASFVERLPIKDVQLSDLRAAPSAYLNTRVRFRAVFVDTPGIYDPIHTPYSAERYLNVAVWDDEDRLYDPQVRARPLVTLYFDKRFAAHSDFSNITRYQVVDIVGEVASMARGLPWVSIHSMTPVEGASAYNDRAIYHVEQATVLATDGAYELADARFGDALREPLPPHAQMAIHELRARNAMTAGKHGDAAASLRTALALASDPTIASDQERADLHYLLAKAVGEVAHESEGEARAKAFEDAVAHARAGLQIDPTNGDAYAVLGISLAGLGRFDEARRECAQAIRLQPNNAEVRWYLGRILDSQGDHDAAIEALKKAIDLTPKDHRIHKAIAAAYYHRALTGAASAPEDYSTAVREYDIALRLRPDDADSAYESGVVLQSAAAAKTQVQLGDEQVVATTDHAIARFQAALALDTKHIPSLLALADVYQKTGKVDDAIRILTDLTAAEPTRIEAATQLANLHVGKGAHDQALATLEAFRAANPQNTVILTKIGSVALAAGKPEAGLNALDALTKAEPRNGSAWADLAECHLASGNAREAVRTARLAVRYAEGETTAKAADVLARAEAAANAR